jgi:hypothetical protein
VLLLLLLRKPKSVCHLTRVAAALRCCLLLDQPVARGTTLLSA